MHCHLWVHAYSTAHQSLHNKTSRTFATVSAKSECMLYQRDALLVSSVVPMRQITRMQIALLREAGKELPIGRYSTSFRWVCGLFLVLLCLSFEISMCSASGTSGSGGAQE